MAVYTDILSTITAILHLKSMNDLSFENTKSKLSKTAFFTLKLSLI